MSTTIFSKAFIVSLCFSVITQWTYAFQQQTEIKEVTVYLDGAEVTRTVNLNVKSGKTEFLFDGLSPHIDESSIQISGLKTTSVLSINYGINHVSKRKHSDSIEYFKSALKQYQRDIQNINDIISGYQEELSLIQNNKQLGNESEVVNLEKLKAFAAYYRTRKTELNQAINKARIEIADINSDMTAINKQLAELNVSEEVKTGEIRLKLHSESPNNIDLIITYNISNAGWFPIYDIKADKINSPINLEYKAHVYQNSGCDWDNVKLVLSTGDPNTNNLKPDLDTKYLNFVNPYSYQSQRATKRYNYKYNPLVKTISGVVTASSDGLPLPGVSIVENGTSNGVQTDFDGRYSIKTNAGKELVYSFVGMQTEKLPIHSSIMNVTMNEDLNTLDEVVVTGYSSTTKAQSSVASIRIDSDVLENRPNASFVQTLAGQVPGLNMTTSSGQPGGSSLVQLRGAASVNSNSEPLFVINGVPVRGRNIERLRNNDIASVSVLKDAQATAVYGNRGRNGVVVIQLKEGTALPSNIEGIAIDQGITNTRFEIDKHYSIPSDGDVTVIEINTFKVPAEYDYYAAPVLNENVFLTAKISDWEQYNLLPAEANVYFEGSYSGKTNIDPLATTESLVVSLGVDPNIVVKRKQLNNFKKTTFIGNNRVVYKGYEISVKNNKVSDVKINLADRIPITQNKYIKISDEEYGDSEFNVETGLLKWELDLKSGENQKVEFSYSVKYPKNKHVNL